MSDFFASRSSPWKTVNTRAGKLAYKASRRDSGFLETLKYLSLIHISEPTRRTPISYAVFCLNSGSLAFFSRAKVTRKKIAQSFLSTAKFITKYPSERFLSICGEQIYLKAF